VVSVLWGLAAYGFDCTCIDVEFESSDWPLHSFLGENVEEFLYDGAYDVAMSFGAVSPLDVLVNFVIVFVGVVYNEVVAGREFVFVRR
jgi:hypothetical protein